MIASNENVIQLFGKPPTIDGEVDCLVLYEDQDSFIHYFRDYVANTEYVVLSNMLLVELPPNERPMSNVLLLHNFHILKYFQSRIKEHIVLSGQLLHFYALFKSSMTEVFERF